VSGAGTSAPSTSTASNEPGTPRPTVRRRSNTLAIVAVVAVVVIIAAGVGLAYEEHWIGGSSKSSVCGPVTLQGDGAQIATPLIQTWAQNYAIATGNQVNYPGAGSGTGITHFTSASIDFGVSDSPLSSAQVAALPSPALTLPVTGSAITIVYNLPGVSTTVHLNLTGQVLASIWLGTITNWNDPAIAALNPTVSLPNATITTVDRSGSAGTTYVFTDFLSQDNKTWDSTVGKGLSVKFPSAAKQTAQSSNSALLTLVNSTEYTIGYSDLTDVLALDTHTLGYASVENPSDTFVTPTLADTASAIADQVAATTLPSSTASWYNVSMVNAQGTGDYPLATFVYMYVYQATQHGFTPSLVKSEVLVQWLDWITSSTEGQSYLSGPNLAYPGLPAAVFAVDATGIGTMNYNGAAIPSC
jgi:phosphate transport system substrate-binding protein